MFMPKHRMCGGMRRTENGFTVIELIAAIIILGILATLSVNMMSDYKLRQNVDSARQQFINAITIASAAASKYNENYSVVYGGNREVFVCPTSSVASCSEQNAEFYSNLTFFQKACPSEDGSSCSDIASTSTTSTGSSKYLIITPFGHILTNLNNNRLYFLDEQKKITTSNGICMGIELSGNGAVETIESNASGTGSC